MDNLPSEVLECIFKNLCQFRYLPSFKLVCKRFYQIIKDIEHREIDNIYKAVLKGKLYAYDSNSQNLQNLYRSLSFNHDSVHIYETTTCYHNKKIFIYGGNASVGTCFKDLWCFNFISREWSNITCSGDLPPPNSSSSLIGHKDQLVLFGGYLGYNHQKFVSIRGNKVYAFNIKQRAWKQLRSSCPRALNGHRATMVGDRMMVFGGLTDHDIVSDEVYVFDTRDSNWLLACQHSTKPPGRFCHVQELVSEDRLLVLAGYNGIERLSVGGGGSRQHPLQLDDAWMLSLNGDGAIEEWFWTRLLVKGSIPGSLQTPINFNKSFKVRNKLVVFARKSHSDVNHLQADTPSNRLNLPPITHSHGIHRQNSIFPSHSLPPHRTSPHHTRNEHQSTHNTHPNTSHPLITSTSRHINHPHNNSTAPPRLYPPRHISDAALITPAHRAFGDSSDKLRFFTLDLKGMMEDEQFGSVNAASHVRWDEQVGSVDGSCNKHHYSTFVLCEGMVVEIGVRDDVPCISSSYITPS